MKVFAFGLLVALSASSLLAADQPQIAANAGFERLKSLVGQWRGKIADGEDVTVSYKLIAAGSALQENLSHGDMVTMYHTDGSNLMLTHYCAAQNQPRMKAAAFKPGDRSLEFSFVDATNMPDKNAMHMHNLTFTFLDNDHFTQEWTMFQDGKHAQKVVIALERVSTASHAAAASLPPTLPGNVCVVSGEKLGEGGMSPYKYTYNDQTIMFCCPHCKPDFEKNPEKYIAALREGKPVASKR